MEESVEEADDVSLLLSLDPDYGITEAAERLILELISSTQSAPMSDDIIQNTSDNNTEITEAGSVGDEDLNNDTDNLECSEEETWVIIEDPVCPGESAEYAQMLCRLKSVCIETVEDFSYKPVSVNVHTNRRSIQITIDVCSSVDNDIRRVDDASYDMDSAEVKTAEGKQLATDIPDDDIVWSGEPTDIKANTETEKEPQGEAPKPSTTEVTQDSTQSEQTSTEEKSVMNFFKTLVTSTKTTKEATASPDVSKQQSQKETPPAPAANVQEASKIPPPPPPAPPKMESKVEPAVKKEEAPPIEVAAAAAKEPETPGKAKTKDSPFGKLFRTKVDASKTRTLEAGAKPEPPPAPKPEEKKAEKKPSPFANLLKPKAAESKKEAPAAPTAPAEATPSTKAKEEPKPAAVAAAPAAASPDNKSVGSTDNSSPSTSRKLEKRNSIHLFFKNLGQKRHSDAGVQTEPVAQEKAK
ncbi:hypothetical protein AMELA_G00201660 [Ameiurus melas]|uniref:Uncharacterized protein n=1 Tax=Ameiurus melas TaxID=219545 RepID=A0A7J6A726_AMEME|nr:hypothetical protein AMELA_G00201660 [Ameiurus melas]